MLFAKIKEMFIVSTYDPIKYKIDKPMRLVFILVFILENNKFSASAASFCVCFRQGSNP